MGLYKVFFKLGYVHSARTMNLNCPSESAAKEALVKQCTISAADASKVVIEKIERV